MIKKTLMAGASAALLAGAMFGRDATSYVSTSVGWMQDSVKDSIPLEFEIERARGLVNELQSDIQQNMQLIAKEDVEVSRLEKQIAELGEKQTSERLNLGRLQTDLATNRESFEYGGQVFTAAQVKADLASRFDHFKTNDATLTGLQQVQVARKKGLEAAREKLTGMLDSRRKLEVDVQNCESRLRMLEAAQATSEVSIDDSRLSRVKSLIGDVQTRLDVATKTMEAGKTFRSDIPVGETGKSDIADQVAEYLRASQPAINPAVANK